MLFIYLHFHVNSVMYKYAVISTYQSVNLRYNHRSAKKPSTYKESLLGDPSSIYIKIIPIYILYIYM